MTLTVHTKGRTSWGVADSASVASDRPRELAVLASLILGVAAVIFVWTPGPPVRPDQFTIPKEAALGLLGLLSLIALAWPSRPNLWWPRIDTPLALALACGLLTSLWVAADRDAVVRSVGAFASAVLTFQVARALSSHGHGARIAQLLAGIGAVAAVVAMCEAFGLVEFISEPGRRPGGTLGNRNTLARLLTLTLPLLWLVVASATRRTAKLLTTLAILVTAATIVLSRSRGAWLMALAIGGLLPLASHLIADGTVRRELARRLMSWWLPIGFGVGLAIVIPNRTGWTVDDYTSTLARAVEYSGGTGRGRVIQAMTTARMIASAPVSGVGAGNWSIGYGDLAEAGDPSLSREALRAVPRVPRGDLLSLTAEYGVVPALLVVTVLLSVGATALGALRDSTTREPALSLLATMFAVGGLGLVDPVLRLPATLAFAAAASGTLLGMLRPTHTWQLRNDAPPSRCGTVRGHQLLGIAAFCLVVSASRESFGFITLRRAHGEIDLRRAVWIAPHSIETRFALAEFYSRRGDCVRAYPHLVHARGKSPQSEPVQRLLEQCGYERRAVVGSR